MALEKELATYRRRLTELLSHQGEYVLIHDEQVLGCYPDYDAALEAGYDRLGLEVPFLVKEIQPTETVYFIPTVFHGVVHPTDHFPGRGD